MNIVRLLLLCSLIMYLFNKYLLNTEERMNNKRLRMVDPRRVALLLQDTSICPPPPEVNRVFTKILECRLSPGSSVDLSRCMCARHLSLEDGKPCFLPFPSQKVTNCSLDKCTGQWAMEDSVTHLDSWALRLWSPHCAFLCHFCFGSWSLLFVPAESTPILLLITLFAPLLGYVCTFYLRLHLFVFTSALHNGSLRT